MPRASKSTEEQVTFAPRPAAAGRPVEGPCRKRRVSPATPSRWEQESGQMGAAEARRPRPLEEGAKKLQPLAAGLSPGKKVPQGVLGRKP